MYRILTSWQPCIESHWRSCLGVIHFLAVSRFIHASYVLSTRAYYLPHDVLVEGVCWSLALIYTYVVDYPLLVVSRHVVDTRYSIILQLQFVRATYYQIARVLKKNPNSP